MSQVGKIIIQTHGGTGGIEHRIKATVNVGGSLIDLDCETDRDPELARLVDQLCARLASLAVETVQASLHREHSG